MMQLHSCHMFLWHLYREPLFAGHPICHKLKDALDVSCQSYITDYIYLDQFQYCHVNKMLHMEKKKNPASHGLLSVLFLGLGSLSLSLPTSLHSWNTSACLSSAPRGKDLQHVVPHDSCLPASCLYLSYF